MNKKLLGINEWSIQLVITNFRRLSEGSVFFRLNLCIIEELLD